MTDCRKFRSGNNVDRNHGPFKATKIWNELIEHLKTNVEPRKRRWKFQFYENSFRGGDVVEVLHAYVLSNPSLSKDASRTQVKSLCQILLEKKVIECVSSDNNFNKKDCFEDTNKLYRFSTGDPSKNFMSDSRLMSAKVERRASKRRSLLGIGEKASARRKSLNFTPRAQKRLADILAPSSLTHLPGIISSDTRGQESPRKRKRFSLDGSLGLRKHKLSALAGPAQDSNSDVWFEVALSELLRLTNVPFLEDILPAPVKDESLGVVVISNHIPCVKRNEEKENLDISTSSDVWVTAGLDCIQLQGDFPLPQRGDVGYVNVMNLSESGILQLLSEYYGSLLDTLIPTNLSDLAEGVVCLFETDRIKTVTALQMLILLLPASNRMHLKKLLNFMGNSSERFVVKKFMNAILPRDVKNKNAGHQLVAFMTEHQSQIFKVSAGLKAFIAKCTFCEQRGLCRPLLSTACQQITLAEYADQGRLSTKESLNKLLINVIEDLKLSLKEKEDRIKLFQKHHNEVFLKQFPTGEL